VTEESGGCEGRADAGMFAVRSGGFAHQVRFGALGALIVSLGFPEQQFAALDPAEIGRWRRGWSELVQGVLSSALRGDGQSDLEDRVWDVLGGEPRETDSHAPPWLQRARERLIEESVSIADLAAESGFHRVHFSRAFGRAFGVPPTLYRTRMSGIRAVAAAIEGGSAAASAHDCGFADQSHMARVLRRVAGNSFKRLRTLSDEVTSVQE